MSTFAVNTQGNAINKLFHATYPSHPQYSKSFSWKMSKYKTSWIFSITRNTYTSNRKVEIIEKMNSKSGHNTTSVHIPHIRCDHKYTQGNIFLSKTQWFVLVVTLWWVWGLCIFVEWVFGEYLHALLYRFCHFESISRVEIRLCIKDLNFYFSQILLNIIIKQKMRIKAISVSHLYFAKSCFHFTKQFPYEIMMPHHFISSSNAKRFIHIFIKNFHPLALS